ncbi:hypothetical protein HanRHA438_Chr11g0524521 [Helianthus annuus]|nr:hypothetical protein HanIR_Chr11g0550641 [Helianthus annuus]KAJ0872511.1 hypothetical protein HanRHA438_Chr11g0524521 [Helianthus annuus]
MLQAMAFKRYKPSKGATDAQDPPKSIELSADQVKLPYDWITNRAKGFDITWWCN